MTAQGTCPVRTLQPLEQLDYYDSQSIMLPVPVTPIEAWNLITGESSPLLRLAFRIRDAISSRFRVKAIGGFSGARRQAVQAGEHLDFFLVEQAAPDLLALTARDRHLDVMTRVSTSGRELAISSSVVIHNGFGRAYMMLVGPAHRLIVRTMLRRLARRLETAPPPP